MPRKKTVPTKVEEPQIKQGQVANLVLNVLDVYKSEFLSAIIESDVSLSQDEKLIMGELANATLVGVRSKALNRVLKLYEP